MIDDEGGLCGWFEVKVRSNITGYFQSCEWLCEKYDTFERAHLESIMIESGEATMPLANGVL
jgi:hypothetical protein